MSVSAAVRLAWTAVCAAACVPYLGTVTDYFVQDDFGVVQLLAQKPWTTFPRWFAMPWMEDIWGYTPDEIRPFPALSYQITALWGAAVPEGHHLLNIALHAVNSLLVLTVARRVANLGLAGATLAGVSFALLPVAAESVAWITGRVDTMPTLFYLASFLAYVRWRQQPGSLRPYVWALVWFFLALFSKQNTITMVAGLMAYDALLARRPVKASWEWLRPYVPFAVMTFGFLALRYVVLGEVLRESQLSPDRVAQFHGVVIRHLQRIVFGEAGGISTPAGLLALTVAAAVALAAIRLMRRDTAAATFTAGSLLYFGVVWIGLGLAPAVAAGYESPRHAYLAAVGWAIVVGTAFEVLWRVTPLSSHGLGRLWRLAVIAAVAATLLGYSVRLYGSVSQWSRRAAVSHIAATELERHVMNAPPGSLVLIDVPVSNWEWAVPFVARPPYAAVDLTERASIVAPELLHCCRGRPGSAAHGRRSKTGRAVRIRQ